MANEPGALAGRAVLVTGGGRNIGRAIAAAAARAGAAVAVLEKDRGGAREAIEGLAASGARAVEVAADLRDPAAVARAVEEAATALGRLDGLVNNAGVYVRGPFLDTTPDHFDLTLGVNLKGAFFATQAFGRLAKARGGGGAVVSVASVHGSVGDASVVAHCASKAGLLGFTRAAAEALRPLGVRVNAVSPGAVATWNGPWDAPRPAQPLDGMLVPSMVADAVVWLLSDAAAGVTGAEVVVGGGTAFTLRTP
jgi:NAD(P)-dependent dehydrogenase (short-subunit alcohol dehydrogenase family)